MVYFGVEPNDIGKILIITFQVFDDIISSREIKLEKMGEDGGERDGRQPGSKGGPVACKGHSRTCELSRKLRERRKARASMGDRLIRPRGDVEGGPLMPGALSLARLLQPVRRG